MIYSDQPVTNCFIQQNQFREGAEINGKFCENVLQNPFWKLLDLWQQAQVENGDGLINELSSCGLR